MDDAEIQNQVAQMQINYLIQQLESYHGEDEKLMAKIQSAKQQLEASNNIQAAAATLNVCFFNNFLVCLICSRR